MLTLIIAIALFVTGYDFCVFCHNRRVQALTLSTLAVTTISLSDIPAATTLPVAPTPTVEVVQPVVQQVSKSDRLPSLNSQYTVRQLKDKCKGTGLVKGYGSLSKAELIVAMVSVGLI